MRWQKNMSQMKEQVKNLQDQINEEEIGNLPEKEFRVMTAVSYTHLTLPTSLRV